MHSRYAAVVSTLALVVALTGVGAQASGVFVTSKQIKNGTITSKDIHKNGVKTSDIGTEAVGSTDIKTAAVQSADIGEGQVEPQDVTMPAPVQIQKNETASVEVNTDYVLVDSVGTYTKTDPTSALEVDWTGTAGSPFGTDCLFQLRVDGQPSANGAGTIFIVSGPTALSVSSTALFAGLPTGPHKVEVWARAGHAGGSQCIVGPSEAGIPQTFVIGEIVV